MTAKSKSSDKNWFPNGENNATDGMDDNDDVDGIDHHHNLQKQQQGRRRGGGGRHNHLRDSCNSLPGPSSASTEVAATATVAGTASTVMSSSLDDAYEYVKAQEESGFGDPLIGNDDNFDIFQYIGAGDTPESGSPASFGAATACNNNNTSSHHLIYQQQQHHHQHHLQSELVQALHAPSLAAPGGGVGAVQQQQQHQQHLLKETAAMAAPQHNGIQHQNLLNHHHHHHHHQQHLQQQQSMVLDNVGQMMYSSSTNGGGVGGCAAAAGPEPVVVDAPRIRELIEARVGGGAQTRLLPDSPPITDASGGASSISPGSSGGASSSPFSPPDQYNHHHHHIHNHHQLRSVVHQQAAAQQQQEMMNGGGVDGGGGAQGEVLLIQQHPRGDMLLLNHHGQMGGSQMMVNGGNHHHQQQQQLQHHHPHHHRSSGMLICGGNGDGTVSATECLHSPNSEFLSPYPPSQSTPGSHHSAQQISPPALSHQSKGITYLLQSQSANAFVASMDNLYTATTDESMMDEGAAAAMGASQHHHHQQQQFNANATNNNTNDHSSSHGGGMKRRRMSSSVTPGVRDCAMPLGNSTNLPNIKSEVVGGGGSGTSGVPVAAAAIQPPSHGGSSCSSNSSTTSPSTNGKSPATQQHQNCAAGGMGVDQQQQQRMLLLQQSQHHQQQPQHHHQSFDELDENMNSQRTIRFEPYIRDQWNVLYDFNRRPLQPMPIAVVADKGFNYSASDNCFVNQKKNHFQITVNIGVEMGNGGCASGAVSAAPPTSAAGNISPQQQVSPFTPHYVCVNGELLEILDNEFFLSFCGVKSEMQSTEISIKQSQADRKPVNHDPESFKIDGTRSSVRQTVARLHFGETTMNNHRKNGKPNPEQKYFLLVVKLLVKTQHGIVLAQAFHSDRVIVRASNPGQFEQPDQELNWRQGQHGSLAFPGQVCIGAGGDKPIDGAALTVYGNIATTGNVTRPSDRRVKEDIVEVSTAEAMARVAQMRLVEFAYKPDIAQRWGLTEQDRHRVGVIAQELAEVLPEAVKDNGEFLTVDDTRVFYEIVAAAQELYRLTGNLGSKLDQVEKISQKLARYAQKRRQLGSMASGLSDLSTFFGGTTKSLVGADGGGGGGGGASGDAEIGTTGSLAAGAGGKHSSSCISYSRTSLTSAITCNTMPTHCGGGGSDDHCDNDHDDNNGGSNGRAKQRKSGGGGGATKRKFSSDRYAHRCRSYSSASAYCSRPYYGGGGGGVGTGPCTVYSPLCNSKFTQGTIVTLVIIMALCLVTMCTLYVMDWYNRTYVFPAVHLIDAYGPHHPYHHPHHPSSAQTVPAGGDHGGERQHQQPQQQQTEPLKMVELFVDWKLPDRPQNVPALTVLCAGAAVTTAMMTPLSSLVPVSLGGPDTCAQYCCSTTKLASYKNFGVKLAKSVDDFVALASTLVSHNVVAPPATLQLAEHHQQNVGIGGGALHTLSNGAKFEVLNVNFTIDGRYCVNESCDARNGHFNLFVPISEHFPTIPLQMRISTDDSTLFVDDCGPLVGFQHKPCQQFGNKQFQLEEETNRSQPPDTNRVAENIFELSAGSFLQSAYRFRIGHSANLCQRDDRQRGRAFDEYNLFFYRTCAHLGKAATAEQPPATKTTTTTLATAASGDGENEGLVGLFER